MAITFLEEKKRQRYLIVIFIILIVVIIGVIWQSFFREREVIPGPEVVFKPPVIKINFEILKSPALEELQPFEPIPSLEEEIAATGKEVKIGRDNPFLPYKTEVATPTAEEITE